jgi:hypothetical protein
VVGVVLAGTPLLGSDRAAPALEALGALSLVFLAFSLARGGLLAFVLVTLTSEFTARKVIVGVGAGASIAYGAGLLLLCELLAWAETLRAPAPALVERVVVIRRALHLGGLMMLAALSAALVVLGADISSPDAFVAGVAGAVAAVALFGLARSLST